MVVLVAAESTPMKRGLKLRDALVGRAGTVLAAESTPMKRGLKQSTTATGGQFILRSRREHPDEEGTETVRPSSDGRMWCAPPQRAPR